MSPNVSAQSTCTEKLNQHWDGTGGTLNWNIHADAATGDCVLELEGGVVPNYGEIYTQIPWYNSSEPTQVIVSHRVVALDCFALFSWLRSVRVIDVSLLDVTSAPSMKWMFTGCISMSSLIGLDSWRTPNVTILTAMFAEDVALSSLDLSSFDMSRVSNVDYMFNNMGSTLCFLRLKGDVALSPRAFVEAGVSTW